MDAWTQGYDARHNGQPEWSNPFDEANEPKHGEWWAGWMAADRYLGLFLDWEITNYSPN